MLKNKLVFAAIAGTVTSAAVIGWTNHQTPAQSSSRTPYRAINVQQFVSQNRISGLNPNQTAVKLFADKEEAEGRQSESIDIKYSRNNTAVIMLTKEGLADDSVRALRQRIEMQRNQNGRWSVIWVGEQNKCQRGRGSQTWTAKSCL